MAITPGLTIMITGQQEECTKERFDTFYKPAIDQAYKLGAQFILGAADGADYHAGMYLEFLCPERVTIYDKGERDGRRAVERGFRLKNGFASYPARDEEMREKARGIIVYLFEHALTSGTFENVLRFVCSRAMLLNSTTAADLVMQTGRLFDRASKHSPDTAVLDYPHYSVANWLSFTVSPPCPYMERFENTE